MTPRSHSQWRRRKNRVCYRQSAINKGYVERSLLALISFRPVFFASFHWPHSLTGRYAWIDYHVILRISAVSTKSTLDGISNLSDGVFRNLPSTRRVDGRLGNNDMLLFYSIFFCNGTFLARIRVANNTVKLVENILMISFDKGKSPGGGLQNRSHESSQV